MLIIDDQRLFAEVIQTFLGAANMQVAVELSGLAGVDAARRLQPDVILIDLMLPDGNGVDFGRRILELVPGAKVIALTALSDPKIVTNVVRAGFHGYLTKDTPLTNFVGLIQTALAGQVVLPHKLAAAAAGARSQEERHATLLAEQLSNREREVLAELVAGSSSREIAESLGVTPNTVRTHVQSILNKLQVHSRLEAASFAVRFGLVQVPRTLRGSTQSIVPRRANRSM